jgi:UDP:flavonoid glycosyltransferase YjiC (YdhE family)
MRVVILSFGTRGDVAPFTGLGSGLREAGHEVVLAAHESFAPMVHDAGLTWRPMSPDARALLAGEAGQAMQREGTGFRALFSRWGNRAVSRALPRLAAPVAGFVKDFQRRMGVPATGLNGIYRGTEQQQWPIVHGFSPHVVPRPADWRTGIDVVGYWWPFSSPSWQPPRELVDFLESGSAPVFFGLGSMAQGQGERLSEIISEVVRRTGCRAVVQAGWSGLTATGDDVITVDDVPHEWLFPRMAAIVHHGGAGTTAAGLRAGIPAVPITVFADQPFWAERLRRIGVSPGSVSLKHVTADRVADLLQRATAEPAFQHRARAIAEHVRHEDGAGHVVEAVERLDARCRHHN